MIIRRKPTCATCDRTYPQLEDGKEYVEWTPLFQFAPRRFKIMDPRGHRTVGCKFWFFGYWYISWKVN